MGISGKISSLTSVATACDAHIIGLAETKLGRVPPVLPGYSWYNKPRKPGSGGVAILVRNDIKHMTEQVQGMEDHDQEILWIKIKNRNTPVYIGVFYGVQENTCGEEAQRQFSQITTQVNKLNNNGEIILMGDFNAKLRIVSNQVNQEESRNGKLMQNMMNSTNLISKATMTCGGMWTRVNRKNTSERSIIDYILMSNSIAMETKHVEVDEKGTYRLKGKQESDHNTMIIETEIPKKIKTEKHTVYNLKDHRKWKMFNRELHNKYTEEEPESYETFEKMLKDTMESTFDKITIKKGTFKPKLSEKAKALKSKKKTSRKAFERASPNEKRDKMEEYINIQKQLVDELEEIEKQNVQARIKKIIKEGGIRSDSFWKIRKKILKNSNTDDSYDTITEEGVTITDPEEAKEYIAQYYENLYQAREGKEQYKEWTEKIKNKVIEIERDLENRPEERSNEETQFTMYEMCEALKCLKPGKAPGPDGIPNEVLKRANKDTLPIYLQEMNKIMNSTNIPEQWTEGNLKRLYKGKGKKGKCSNERGITLASNIGKTFERLVNNRIKDEVNISDAQAGGMKGRATVDHILILKELINICKKRKTEAILVYLDVTKAYDKAWLDAIMYVLNKQGVDNKLWLLVKKLNSNLKTTVMTKYGPTRKISIKDSIRQGGVLSVILYALMMDEINKELVECEKGLTIPNTETKIPSLLWMDDVVLIENEKEKVQEMLNITNDVSNRYHVEFGMQKTKFMRTSKKKDAISLNIYVFIKKSFLTCIIHNTYNQ